MTSISTITPKGVKVGAGSFDAFKDSQGRFRTLSLFYETRHKDYPAFFTTKKRDITRNGVDYISLYLKYMEIADPTEYQVAVRLFGSWDHWQTLLNTKWFKELVTGWREELKVKLESDRFYEMRGHLADDGPSSIQATKWLAERYGEKATTKRGRPSKEEKNAHLKRLAEETSELDEDAKRIGL